MHLSSYMLLVPYLTGLVFTAPDFLDDNTIIPDDSANSPPDPILHTAAPAMKLRNAPAYDDSMDEVVEVRAEANLPEHATIYDAAPEPTTLAKRTKTWKHHDHTKHSHTGKRTHTGTHTKHGTWHKAHKHMKTTTVEAGAAVTPAS